MATNDNGRLYFSAGIDTAQLKKDAEKIEQLLRGVADTASGVGIGEQLKAEFAKVRDEASATAQALDNIWEKGSFGLQSATVKFGGTESMNTLLEQLAALEDASADAQGFMADMGNEASLSAEKFERFGAQAVQSVATFQQEAAGLSVEGREAEYQRLSLALQEMGSQGATAFNQLAAAGEVYHQNIAVLEQAIGALIIQQQDMLARGEEGDAAYAAIGETLTALQTDLEAARAGYASLQEQQEQMVVVMTAMEQQQDALNATMEQCAEDTRSVEERLIDMGEQFKNTMTANGQFSLSAAQANTLFGSSLKSVGISLPGIIAGARSLLVTMKAMVATPLGAILTVVAIALQAVTKWFNKSAEGQKAFAVVSGYVGSVLNSLMDVVIGLGKALYKLFSGDFKGAWEAAVEGVSNGFTDIGKKAKENAQLSLQQKELELERVDAERQTLEIQKEIAEERAKIYGMEPGSLERQKAIEALQSKTLQLTKAQQEVAQKEADILAKKNSLHASTIEDLAAEAQARNKVLRLQVQAVQSQVMLARLAGANQRSMASGTRQNAKEQEALNKATNDYIKAMEDAAAARVELAEKLADRIAEAEIAAMEDAGERVKAERAKQIADEMRALEDERDKALEELRKRQKETYEKGAALDSASGGGYVAWDDAFYDMGANAMEAAELEDQYAKLIAAKQAARERERVDKEAAAMREYLKVYGDYLEKRQALQEEYDEAMAKAETEGERKTLTARYEEEITKLGNEELKESLNWDELFVDLSDKGVAALEVLKQKIVEVIATNKELSAADAAALNAQVEKIERAQDASSAEFWQQLDANASSAREAIGALGLEDSDIGEGLQNLADGYASASSAYDDFMSGNFLGALANGVNALKSFGAVFGIGGLSDKHLLSDMERLTESNRSLENAIDNLAAIMSESTTTLAEAKSAYETQLANYDELQANLQEQMSRSGATYDSGFLGISGTHSSNYNIDKALSADDWAKVSEAAGVAVSSAGDFWTLTSEQMYKVATYATTQYDKIKQAADDGAADAAQYMDEYISLWEELEEIQDAYYEKLTSYSFDDITSEFQSMLSDMESSTADFTESFEEMMVNAIVNSMMSDAYAQRLEDWYNSFVDAMEDSSLSSSELSALQSEYEDIVSDATAARDALLAAAGLDDLSSSSRSGASGGITQASQDSVDEMNARLTTMQGHTYSLNENTKLLLTTSQAILSSVLNIESDTGSMDTRLSNIESKVGAMSSTLSDIQLRGLVLRS